jgi:hypothetical protein
MGFWTNTWSNALGGIAAALFIVLLYALVQWFLRATDLLITYNWRFDTVNGVTNFRPNFDIRNRSGSKTYRLANIAYTRDGAFHWFDNVSLWGAVLEPGSINNQYEVVPVRDIRTISRCVRNRSHRPHPGRTVVLAWRPRTGTDGKGTNTTHRFLAAKQTRFDTDSRCSFTMLPMLRVTSAATLSMSPRSASAKREVVFDSRSRKPSFSLFMRISASASMPTLDSQARCFRLSASMVARVSAEMICWPSNAHLPSTRRAA